MLYAIDSMHFAFKLQAQCSMLEALGLGQVLASHGQGFHMEYIVHITMPQIKKIGARFARRVLVVVKLKNWGPTLGNRVF